MKRGIKNVVSVLQAGLLWAKIVGLSPICDLSWWAILAPVLLLCSTVLVLVVCEVALCAWSERNLL